MRSLFDKKQDQEIADLYKSGKTTEQIAQRFGVYKQSVLNSLKRTGTPRRKVWEHAKGEKNALWKGGVRMIHGYKHILKPKHPLARKDGYIAEHRFLMADKITKKSQVVHHKDGNILNNNISNLEIFSCNGSHRALHSQTQTRDNKGQFA